MEHLDFIINTENERHSPLSVEAIYYVFADENYDVRHLKIPKTYVLVATLSGKGVINLNEASYELRAGDILIFDASKYNFNYYCVDLSWNFWWFEFKINDKDFLEIPFLKIINHPLNENKSYLCKESLCALKLKDKKTSSSLFSSLICLLQKQNSFDDNNYKGIEIFKRADEYIRKNLATVTVKDTADYLKISERTLLSVFRNQLNTSTVNYINNLKTDMARHLLLTSELTIQSIAEMLGYPDQFVFSKSFKKRFGLSPKKYKLKEKVRMMSM